MVRTTHDVFPETREEREPISNLQRSRKTLAWDLRTLLANAVYQQEAAWTEKFYLMHLYGIRNWERETSFFPISIHTMWIGKLSLWSLRSPPSAQNPSRDQELVEWNQKVCVGFVFILARTLDSRENPFIKLDSDLFSRLLGSGSVCLASVSVCTLPRSKSWQRPEESSVNNGTQPLPI